MSKLVRDRDMQIEALTHKNESLLHVLHQQQQPADDNGADPDGAANDGSRVKSLVDERAELLQQLTVYQQDREQLIVAIQQKHQESVGYHAEIQRLQAKMSVDHGKLEEELAYVREQLKSSQDQHRHQEQVDEEANQLREFQNKLSESARHVERLELSHSESETIVEELRRQLATQDEELGVIRGQLRQSIESNYALEDGNRISLNEKMVLEQEMNRGRETARHLQDQLVRCLICLFLI